MRRRGHLPLALLAFVLLGMTDGVLGVSWPSMRRSFDRPITALALLVVTSTMGYLTATVVGGRLVARFGTAQLLAATTTGSTLAFVTFAVSPSWWPVVGAAVIAGFGSGSIDTALNAYVAVHHGPRGMNFMHACFGVGATAGPIVVAIAITAADTWRAAYAVLFTLAAALAVGFTATRHDWLAMPTRQDVRRASKPSPRLRVLIIAMLALFLVYVGLEVSTGQWSYSLLVEARDTATSAAALWVAAYWGALTLGRVVGGLVAHRVTAHAMLRLSMAGSVAGACVLWWNPLGLGVLGLPVLGLGLASVFPTLVSLTPERLGEERALNVIGYQLTAAGLGGALLPASFAAIAGAHSLEALGPFLTAAALTMVVLHVVTSRLAHVPAVQPAVEG